MRGLVDVGRDVAEAVRILADAAEHFESIKSERH
jgi:hypothetical protein